MHPQSVLLLWSWLVLAGSGCSAPLQDAGYQQPDIQVAGRLQNPAIAEASGLARSARQDRLWVINDSGAAPQLHAIGLDGADQGTVTLAGAQNVDWEDLATFAADGRHWLIVADIGDNNATRSHCTLYVLQEPDDADIASGGAAVSRQIRFRYPDGARDAESLAVDAGSEKILVLSKRDIPALLYQLPLFPDGDDLITAQRVGPVDGIPQPTAYDIERAVPDLNWHWQPNAMDIAADGKAAAILSYRAVYYFLQDPDLSWHDTFRSPPRAFGLDEWSGAESVAVSNDGRFLYVTTESVNAPLLRIALH